MPDRCDVVLVGAGPVGLALALGLARSGRSVTVLEKEAGTAEHSRAPAIWPRTQEVLAGLGVIERFLDPGIRLERIGLRDADHDRDLLRLPLEELEGETPYPWLLILPQSETERLLFKAVQEQQTARVLFSAEVTNVEQDDSTVRVTYRREGSLETVEADFAVGCDGAHSVVRDCLGASFGGETYGTRAALADLKLAEPRDLPFPRLSTRSGLAVAIRIDQELWRLILPFAAGDGLDLDERIEMAAKALFPQVDAEGDYETVWQSEFRLHRRVSSRFVDGRIALAGDAAHLNSPVGGQGMNAGLQDVEVLIPVLRSALDSGDPARLADYERARREAITEGVNRFTDRLTRVLLFGGGRLVKPTLRLVDLTLRLAPLRRRFLRRMAMLDKTATSP